MKNKKTILVIIILGIIINMLNIFYIPTENNMLKKVMFGIGVNGLIVCFIRYIEYFAAFGKEVFGNHKLIRRLAKNDFKTKFAGSYLGIIWAFVQPVVTVLVYWFVFEVGLRSGEEAAYPFVLWLVAGLVPWFFFSEALNSGTNALLEYNYLVKKVVFKIDIIPVVKVISALFVHVFFVSFTLFLYVCYGYFPDFYALQVVYYSFCAFIFVLGLSYMTSAVVVFFRDLTPIINIILQVGVWMTPIMWQLSMVPERFLWVFKLNPMYYIVHGYRSALIDKIWFWENYYLTGYFWLVTLTMFGIGVLLFKRLKVHFADVL
jgi:ABC-type polysaccharide/polyol phosphate export systems, permease component